MPPVAIIYLSSHFLSVLGNGIIAVALPLIVLQTGLSPMGVGAVSLATAIPALLVGLGAGVVLDRFNRRTCSMVLVIGPALAGTLLTLLDGSAVLLVTAATSAAAALLTIAMPHRLGEVPDGPQKREPLWTQLAAGATVLRHSRFLTGTVALTIGLAVVLGGLQGLVLPLYFNAITRPELLGFVLTALAVGMLVGTGTFAAFGARGLRRSWLTAALIGTTAGFGLITTLASPAAVFAGAALLGLAVAAQGSVIGVLQAERIPDDVRGRVLSLQNACLQVAAPAGIGVAGVVAEHGSLHAAGLTMGAVWLVVVIALVMSRALRDLERTFVATVERDRMTQCAP